MGSWKSAGCLLPVLQGSKPLFLAWGRCLAQSWLLLFLTGSRSCPFLFLFFGTSSEVYYNVVFLSLLLFHLLTPPSCSYNDFTKYVISICWNRTSNIYFSRMNANCIFPLYIITEGPSWKWPQYVIPMLDIPVAYLNVIAFFK